MLARTSERRLPLFVYVCVYVCVCVCMYVYVYIFMRYNSTESSRSNLPALFSSKELLNDDCRCYVIYVYVYVCGYVYVESVRVYV